MVSLVIKDSNEFLKEQEDYSADIIFCDPPYALGSEVIIREDGKPDYKRARDFMDKWDMPTGDYWEEFFKEAFRVLKHGGYLLMFSIDRQNFLFKYYAHLAGFRENQSLYWYYISNFPKASDLSKMIDKHFGAKRRVIGKGKSGKAETHVNTMYSVTKGGKSVFGGEYEITAPTTELAKKYEGYKYSIAPLKQVVEEIMVFQKPYKTGSCLRDVLKMEDGDETITCGAIDIERNRVGFVSEKDKEEACSTRPNYKQHNEKRVVFSSLNGKGSEKRGNPAGRYPAQAFVDGEVAKRLDKQSGLSKSTGGDGSKFKSSVFNLQGAGCVTEGGKGYGDIAGCSKALHKCDFEKEDIDLFIYNPKVSKKERNAGLDELEDKESEKLVQNNHPTVKPISLNYKILKLFKAPNAQTVLIPFAGSGSEIIGAIKAGFENIKACEINPEYVKIAKARIKYWNEQFSKEEKEQLKFNF